MNTCPGWLALVTFCFVYNAWAIPFRQFFRNYQHEDNITAWLVSDYLADLVYLLDILIIKYRIMFMENGFWVKDRRELCKIDLTEDVIIVCISRVRNYVRHGRFVYDLLALAPLDLLYLQFGLQWPILRLPRLMKYGDFKEFFTRLGRSDLQSSL